MIKNSFCLLCKTIITSKEENLTSYIDTIDAINVKQFPVNIGPLAFGTLWKKEGDEVESIKFKCYFCAPDGKEKEILTTEKLEMNSHSHRMNICIQALKIEKPGAYKMIIEYDSNDTGFRFGGEVVLKVNKID